MRVIMCVDLDYFYAAVEENRDESLKDKPVVVCVYSGRSPESGAVATSNYKARALGIKSGMPISLAKKIDRENEAVFLPTDMELYRKISSRIMSLMKNYADRFEQVSIDEAYLDVSDSSGGDFKKAEKIGRDIKKEIFDKEKLTCSVGIGPNKLISKMASGKQKPDGLTLIMPQEVKLFLESLGLKDLHGIGPKTEKTLKDIGIDAVEGLARAETQKLRGVFGENKALNLRNKAMGIDDDEVEDSEKQQLSKIGTLKENTRNFNEIMDKMNELSDELEIRIKEQNVSFRTVSIIAITTSLDIHTKSKTLDSVTNNIDDVKKVSLELMDSFLEENKEFVLRRCGVKVSGFQKGGKSKEEKKQKTLGEF